MRKSVFLALNESKGDFVSGEQISERLSISRAAVSKHIAALRADGADIESISHNGHRMISLPDRMKDIYVLPLLKTADLIDQYAWYDEIGSTNDILKQSGEKLNEISICTCEDQISGKGRRGRIWESSKHNAVYVSFLLKPDISTAQAFQITCLAAVAQVKAIKAVTGLAPEIKWPNDIVLNGKKISGTLTELVSDFDGVRFVVCGIGININQNTAFFKGELSDKATSLAIEKGSKIERLRFITEFIDTFITLYLQFKESGADVFIGDYKEYSAVIGKDVVISSGNETLEGSVSDIDDSGAIILSMNGKLKRIVAGEVSLRGKHGYV